MGIENDDGETAEQGKAYTATLDEMNARDEMMEAARMAMEALGETPEGQADAAEPPKKKEPEGMPPPDKKDPPPKKKEEPPQKTEAAGAEDEGEGEKPREGETATARIAREMRARENARKIEREAEDARRAAQNEKSEATRLFNEAKQMHQQMQTFFQTVQREVQQDPVAFMTRMGWQPDAFIDASVRAKDPNYQQNVQLQQALRERDGTIGKLQERLDALEARAKGYEEERSTVSQQEATKRFFDAIPKDSLARKMENDYLVRRANEIGEQYYQRTGKVASPEELGEYVHWEMAKRFGAADPTAEQTSAGSSGKAGKAKANGSRALSARDASESHGGVKPVGDMSAEEERDFLIRVANGAMGR